MKSTKFLRDHWRREAKNLPEGSPFYAEAFAERIAMLANDVDELEQKLKDIQQKAEINYD